MAREVLVKAIGFQKELGHMLMEVGPADARYRNVNGLLMKHIIIAIQYTFDERYPRGHFFGHIRDFENIRGYLNHYGTVTEWADITQRYKAVRKTIPETERRA